MLVLEEIFRDLVSLIVPFLEPFSEGIYRLLKILLFQVPLLKSNHLVLLVTLDGFLEKRLLLDLVLLEVLKLVFEVDDFIVRKQNCFDDTTSGAIRGNCGVVTRSCRSGCLIKRLVGSRPGEDAHRGLSHI